MKKSILRIFVLTLIALAIAAGTLGTAKAQTVTTLTIEGVGGPELVWLRETVKPAFEATMKAAGKNFTVQVNEFTGTGDALRQRYSLDIGAGAGGDVLSFDGFWIPDFASAKLLKPLKELVGPEALTWDGWSKTPAGLQTILSYNGDIYGYPRGTDVRVIWYRKDLIKQAGLPDNWQPKSWTELLDAARKIKTALPGVTPLQLNAGKAMGEATTLQGYLMALLGTGQHVYDFKANKWVTRSKAILDTLKLYKTIYTDEKLGESRYQLVKDGRDQSFLALKDGKVAMLVEGDYLWRSVLAVGNSSAAEMTDRDAKIGFAKMPAQTPGSGYNGQDFVTISGGTGFVINPNTKNPKEAWALLTAMFSKESFDALQKLQPRIRPRTDVPVTGDPVMSALVSDVLPLTTVRPALPTYTKVSEQIQIMTEAIVTGDRTPEQAMDDYAKAVEAIVGKENTLELATQ